MVKIEDVDVATVEENDGCLLGMSIMTGATMRLGLTEMIFGHIRREGTTQSHIFMARKCE
jgi:hypothetical protein